MWSSSRRFSQIRLLSYITVLLAIVLLIGSLPHLFFFWLMLMLVNVGQPDAVRQKSQDFVFATFQRLALFFYEHVNGTQFTLYGDVEEVLHRKERALYLSNHQSAVDWVVVDMLAVRAAVLGQTRYILKDSIKYLPYFGQNLYCQACIYVKRKQLSLERLTASLRYLQNPDIKSWIVMFPEGTRYNLALNQKADWIERSHQCSTDLGLKPLSHLLFPRSRGLWLMLAELGKSLDAVYDVTTIFGGTIDPDTGLRRPAPTLFGFLTLVRPKIHMHIRRIAICDVPMDSEESIKNWLYALFLRKDRILDSYYSQDKARIVECDPFGCPGLSIRLSRWQTVPTVIFLGMILVTPFLLCSDWLQYYCWLWLIGSLIGYVIMAIATMS